MNEHPAREFLLANLSFNLPQLRDLDYILELATLVEQEAGGPWPKRIKHYRAILQQRIAQMEQELKL